MLRQAIVAASERHEIPELLIRAVIEIESAKNPDAVSSAGAVGLMQVMPATGKRFGAGSIDQLFDPATNIEIGTRYLRWLSDRFDADLPLVLAGYNAGEGAVLRHGGRIPPYRETQNYVRRVLDRIELLSGKSQVEISPRLAASEKR